MSNTDELREIRELVGKRIRDARRNMGVERKALAERVPGLTYSSLSMYERGERYPDPKIASRIAQKLGVSTAYLMAISDDPDPNGEASRIAELLRKFSPTEKEFIVSAIESLAQKRGILPGTLPNDPGNPARRDDHQA